MAASAFMSVKRATVNKTNSNYKQALQFNWQYDNVQVLAFSIQIKYMTYSFLIYVNLN